jgi:hypothetical protein
MGPLPKTQTAEEVVELVSGGYVTGSSFAFAIKNTAAERGDRWGMTSGGVRRREVRSIGKLEDVGPVVRPAFEAASVVVSRRAIEMALGDAYRPNQTMANAARKGLNACRGRDDVDQVLVSIAEHIVAREIVSVEEVEYLASVHERCLEARAADWTGSPAWVEWKLAGGEAGSKWVHKRRAAEASAQQVPLSEARSESETSVTVTSDNQVIVEERAEVNLKPTAGMAAAARRGLKLHEEGKSGDGLKPETVARANKLAARENMNEDWVREMNAWFARHESASKSPGWDTPGAEKPGFVAWLLWGGNAAQRWSAAKVAQMDRQESRSMEENVTPPKRALYKALEDIAEIHGPFPPADVNYMPNSPFLAQGMRCANCIFYEGGGGCEIVQGSVSPEGLCQLHIIPEVTMSESESESREGATATVEEPTAIQPDASAASQVSEAESNSVPAAEADPVEALLVKAAELNAAVLRTRLRTMQ